jgi:glucosyl-3-phosphoglycerate synthase
VPARDEAGTIGPIVESLVQLRELGAVDEVVVVDASTDGTADIAARAGADVYAQRSLMPSYGEVLGKGDAMWRALSVLRGDVVCFVDADTERFGSHFASGLELTARPALELFYPQLAGIRQPLAGEIAARRDLLERLPFATGYAVEIAMLIDAYELAGIEAIAQVDLDERQNRHQPLSELGPMATAVLRAVLSRAGACPESGIVERPPIASVRAAA